MEEWKTIIGFENYEVSNLGRVRALNFKKTGKVHLMSISRNRYGYAQVTLYNKGSHCLSVHRLVARAFIPNPDDLPEVDHINRIRDDCRVENLRWVTKGENQKNRTIKYSHKGYAWTDEQRQKLSKSLKIPVAQYDFHHNFIRVWDSVTDAEREGGFNASAINKCCKGKTRTSSGFIWEYVKK